VLKGSQSMQWHGNWMYELSPGKLKKIMETISPNIYLVEDDPFYNNVVATSLEQSNYKVKTFTNGEDYLREIKNHPPDLAIIDYRLGDTNGIDLLEKTKSLDSAINVVILSAHRKMEMINAALKKGASFVHKDQLAFSKLKVLARKAEIDLEERREERIAMWYRIIFFTVFVLIAVTIFILKYRNPSLFSNRG
jgi:FixJ family two-component response regulator